MSLTLGNAPAVDLLVVSPKHEQFAIDVKGQSTKNFWLIRQKESHDRLFFVLVYLPKNDEAPKFCILSEAELGKEMNELNNHIQSIGGKWRDDVGGINWTTAFKYESKWETLPK